MTPETLKALQGSIAKWKTIVESKGQIIGTDGTDCPLCLMFNQHFNEQAKDNCEGCPVAKKTGFSHCEGSPFEEYDSLVESYDDCEESDAERLAEVAQEELEFLTSLLTEA